MSTDLSGVDTLFPDLHHGDTAFERLDGRILSEILVAAGDCGGSYLFQALIIVLQDRSG